MSVSNVWQGHGMVLNEAPPLIMHIDLNSCFATIEQQSNRLLRGRPVGVAAYDTPKGFILAASYQAKARGVGLGVSVQQAKELCPGIVIMTPDPPKYREAHDRFKKLLLRYTDNVVPKSIDEFVLNLNNSPSLRQGMSMYEIGLGMKAKIKQELGEAVTVNIGIGINRFLAKLAAGFDKPDGMRIIDHTNLVKTYKGLSLTDLPGINTGYSQRLRGYGINTPLDFLAADRRMLQKIVFRSINGHHWYMRLRGHEVDDYHSKRSQIGHQYALPNKTKDKDDLARLLLKLCEKTGRRLRANSLTAGGVRLYLNFVNYQEEYYRGSGFMGGDSLTSKKAWHKSYKVDHRLHSTSSIYSVVKYLLGIADIEDPVRGVGVSVFDLGPATPEQVSLFDEDRIISSDRRLSMAIDQINNRYGEFIITPAKMMSMQGEVLDRVAFGSVRDL